MGMQLVNFSIVVIAEHHNPSILNPDFLARCEIVPDRWDWARSEECITTPPLAQVQYINGVAITCEPSRFQVIDAGTSPDPRTSKIPEIVTRYIQTLPHVRYTALGINFHAAIRHDSPANSLIRRFVKDGPWNDANRPLAEAALRLTYPIQDGQFQITMEAGEFRAKEEKTSKPAMIISGNFHHPLSSGEAVTQVNLLVSRRMEYWGQFQKWVQTVVPVQGDAAL